MQHLRPYSPSGWVPYNARTMRWVPTRGEAVQGFVASPRPRMHNRCGLLPACLTLLPARGQPTPLSMWGVPRPTLLVNQLSLRAVQRYLLDWQQEIRRQPP